MTFLTFLFISLTKTNLLFACHWIVWVKEFLLRFLVNWTVIRLVCVGVFINLRIVFNCVPFFSLSFRFRECLSVPFCVWLDVFKSSTASQSMMMLINTRRPSLPSRSLAIAIADEVAGKDTCSSAEARRTLLHCPVRLWPREPRRIRIQGGWKLWLFCDPLQVL